MFLFISVMPLGIIFVLALGEAVMVAIIDPVACYLTFTYATDPFIVELVIVYIQQIYLKFLKWL